MPTLVCDQVQALLSALVDGEIRDRDREHLLAHLDECSFCRPLLEQSRQVDAQLRHAFAPRQDAIARVRQRATTAIQVRSQRRCSVLVVDDEPSIVQTLQILLSSEFDVLTAASAEQAQAILTTQSVDILMSDQRMPRRSGVELLEWVRQHSPRTIRLLMTGHAEMADAIDAINRGAVYHYLLKPWRVEEVLQIIRNAADKFLLERKHERYLEELWHLNRELERRVTDRTRELEEANQLLEQRARELERLALTDPLTGLFNRRAMDELARFELKRHSRYPSPLALGYVDVDHFKQVNTDYLLTGGDEVLKSLARTLAATVREVDSVGRVGGEEFLVIARETGLEGACTLAERLRAAVQNTPIEYNGHQIHVTVSVGFAAAEAGNPASYDEMLRLAAAALAHAKQSGRNRCEVRVVAMPEPQP